jgi:hypothetical protein
LPTEEPTRPGGEDPLAVLRRLEERLDAASDAAERLLGDAVRQGAGQWLSDAVGRVDAAGGDAAGRDAAGGDPAGGDAAEGDPAGGDPEQPGRDQVPPMGWQAAGAREPAGAAAPTGDADLLLALLAGLRDRIPPDLQRRLAEALREVLLALRALIDWYLQRTERPAPRDGGIEDIPIL